jgi:hypothetical protein
MSVQPRRIHVEPNTEVARLLEEARSGPVLLEKEGVLYRLSEADEADIWAAYDPKAVKRALDESAGAFSGMDTDKLKRDLLAQREQDSRGRPA